MVLLSNEETATLNVMSLLMGKKSRDVREMLESLGIQAAMSYSDGKDFAVPLLGKFRFIRNDGEESKGEKRVSIEYTPSSFILRNMMQIDNKQTTDAERVMISRFRQVFKESARK